MRRKAKVRGITNLKALRLFKEKVCDQLNTIDPAAKLEAGDLFSVSLGFFMALDIPFKRCEALAIEARYTHKYWLDPPNWMDRTEGETHDH